MQTPPDFLIDPIGYILFYAQALLPYMILLLSLFVLMVLYLVVTRLARRSLNAAGMGAEASTGIVLVLRLVFFIVAVMILISAFEANLAAILSISAIFGTALGLAFSQALSNIVSGLYVLAARPFRVGDYVRIGGVEGIVREITLNYTRILLSDETIQLVPNNKVVSSEVTNFRIDIREFIKHQEEEIEVIKSERRGWRYVQVLDRAIDKLQEIAGDVHAYRYTFDITMHMSYDQRKIKAEFDKVCKKWESIFATRPIYFIWSKPSAAVTYRFAFIVKDPMTIIKKSSDFLEDLLDPFITGEGKRV
ncbi:MAG: hypothetical protein DRO87_03565 [Candidatus Thorarchaeota archaeon]|nr:MAG: hypothetical protein DRP09_05760 [Candidatus Thorarchaeota archaeon]RLI59203.1 MAG: hypothetical protein DRO87_03565 [Candidatus Thorarchaeota archaeon]